MRNVISSLVLVLASILTAPAWAGSAEKLDWSDWQHLPVFHNGRMMPVNTLARAMAEGITGRANPSLKLEGTAGSDGSEPAGMDETRKLFADGKSRRFTSAELLFSWLVEPERWENVPFLVAGHDTLRKEILELPVVGSDGQHLKFVSPWQLENSRKFGAYLRQLSEKQHEANGQRPSLTELDERVRSLYESYTLYRRLTFDPTKPEALRNRYIGRLAAVMGKWRELEPKLRQSVTAEEKDAEGLVDGTGKALEELIKLSQKDELPLQDLEAQVVVFQGSASRLSQAFAAKKKKAFETPTQEQPSAEEQALRAQAHALAVATADLAAEANEVHLALYDNGSTLRLIPALDPAALEKNRDPNDDAQPWLSVQALLHGSDAVLSGYPKESIEKVRKAFRQVANAYLDRSSEERPKQFAAAMAAFATEVRHLGTEIEPIREKLPFRQKDNELIAATAYPSPDYTKAEVFYYQFDPFFWSWVVSFLAMMSFGLAFGAMRKPMFLAGLAVLLAAQLFTIYGLGLRVYITGWAPVTNMFETVIFVALVVGLMGLWFTVVPLFWTGLTSAWRLTAVPGTPEATPLSDQQLSLASRAAWNRTSLLLLIPRLAIAAAVFWLLTMVSYGSDGGYTIVKLRPRVDVGSSIPTVGNLFVWLVGLSMLGLGMWLLPRAILTGLGSLVTVPYAWFKQGMQEPWKQVLSRKPFALVGAGVGLLAALVAYYAPVFDKNIGLLMPVLRDNFWLTMHVLTITASYGAGALAWGLGNIALAYYLFGRYRDPLDVPATASTGDQAVNKPQGRRAPEVCDALGTFNYKSMQVAVLLLAAGTILGGLWADVSWGRFWGWDSKEVWALVSLLIYLAILHGRYANIFGNFGLAVGSVFGATAILMAWYGVNYVLGSGLHSYGEGTGGFLWVVLVLALNWLFVIAATVRKAAETSVPVAGP